ncbi:MAG: hypothetical protein ACJ8A6_15795 [Gemmatimonadales bacterium]
MRLAFTLSLLALVACDESTTPTEPGVLPSAAAAAAVSYTETSISIGFPVEGGFANSINAAGQVVGTSFLGRPFDVWSGWIWTNGSAIRVGTLGGRDSRANDINDLGQVVGSSQNAAGLERAFRWVNGKMIGLGTLGGRVSRAHAINNRNHVVGESQLTGNVRNPDGTPIIHAFLVKNGVMSDIGTLGGRNSSALNINDDGQVVGWSETTNGTQHPFLWENGTMKDLLPPGSASSGSAADISPSGVIVGLVNKRAFRYADGILRSLRLGFTGSSVASGIRAGRIVGSLTTPAGTRAFVLANGQVTLLPGENNGASDINAAGVIVGATFDEDSFDSPSLWTPQ